MKPIKMVILESNDELLSELNSYFLKQKNFEILAISTSGTMGIELIRQYRPDIVLTSLLLKEVDGFGVMEVIKSELPSVDFIVLGSFADDAIVNRVVAKGAKYYLIKPISNDVIASRILDVMEEKEKIISFPKERERRRTSLDEKISNIFISIGIPPHIKGYNYLREGIKIAVDNPNIINNITKELYPMIGSHFDTTASKVERAIRHAIEVAWNRGRIDAINAVFGVRVYIGSEKPTNSEFIALVADKLILESIV